MRLARKVGVRDMLKETDSVGDISGVGSGVKRLSEVVLKAPLMKRAKGHLLENLVDIRERVSTEAVEQPRRTQ